MTAPRPRTKAPALDGRSRAARLAKRVRADLVRHLGGAPSATQELLIGQAVQLTLRLASMDAAFAKAGGMSDHHTREYLAFSNSLARLTARLGLKGAAPKPATLQGYLASRAPAAGASAA